MTESHAERSEASSVRRSFAALRMTVLFCIFSVAVSIYSGMAFSEESADKGSETKKLEKVVTKKVRGTVSSIGYEKISIETNREGGKVSEMMIPVPDSANFRGRKALKEFQRGDTVDVTYEQIYTDAEEGEKVILGSKAIEVLLVKNVGSDDKMSSREEAAKE